MNLISTYKNGNYTVKLFSDGTKIRTLPDGELDFRPEFPENIDVKISNKCSIGCEFCHENSTCNGKILEGLTPNSFHKELVSISKNDKSKTLLYVNDNVNLNDFTESLKAGTELAIGGGALSEIGDGLFDLLRSLNYNRKIICNITINGKELLNDDFFLKLLLYTKLEKKNWPVIDSFLNNNLDIFERYTDGYQENLIHGLGISYVNDEKIKTRMLALNRIFNNSVIVHTIYGITTKESYDWLAENNFKVLVLGYKNFRRGNTYLKNYSKEIEFNMKNFDDNFNRYVNECKRLSFDCLATEQFKLKEKIPEDVWNLRYMGDDGKFTMYVDLVNGKFGMNSTTPEEKRLNCSDFSYNATLMFNTIKNN